MSGVRLPAECMSCGRRFPSPLAVPAGLRSSAFIGNQTVCPYCGGTAAIVDATVDREGRVEFVRTAFRVLRTPEVTRDDLQRLERLIVEAQAQKSDESVVTARAAAIRPEFGELLKPKTSGDFYQMLGVLLMLILWMVDRFGDPDIQINQTIINQILQGPPPAVAPVTPPVRGPFLPHVNRPRGKVGASVRPTAQTEGAKPKRTHRTKAWKNARCRCGSGKAQRACCG